jgi:hypothetical protein
MGAIVTNVLYVAISLALVAVVGRALSRSGAAFLRERFGGQDGVTEAVNRLLVVAFYLLSAGFLALTWPVWTHVGSAGQALQLLSVKLGELLLVLGALHLASTAVFARLRRSGSWPGLAGGSGSGSGSGSESGGYAEPARSAAPGGTAARAAERPASADPRTGVVSPALWRSRPRHVVH